MVGLFIGVLEPRVPSQDNEDIVVVTAAHNNSYHQRPRRDGSTVRASCLV